METNNQSKREKLESNLDELLKSSFDIDSIEVVNGRINRTWIRDNLGCGANWVSQNDHATTAIAEYEKKLRAKGIKVHTKPSPGVQGKNTKQLMQRVSKLEQQNAQLLEQKSRYKAKLYEYGWIDSDDEFAAQGRLPW
jgi:thiamine kinase-like enzyme